MYHPPPMKSTSAASNPASRHRDPSDRIDRLVVMNCSGGTSMDPFTQMLLEARRDALASLKGALGNVAMIAELVSSLNRQIDAAIGVAPSASGCLGNDPDACSELLAGTRRLLGDLAPTLAPGNPRPPPQEPRLEQHPQQQQQTTAPADDPPQQVRVKQEPLEANEEEAAAAGAAELVVDVDDSMLGGGRPESEPRELVPNVQRLPPAQHLGRRSLQPMVRLGLLQDMIAEAEQEQRLRARPEQQQQQRKRRPGRPPQRRSVVERELAELEEQQREYNRRYRQRQRQIQRRDRLDARPRRMLEPSPERQLRKTTTAATKSALPSTRPIARPTRSCVQQQQRRQQKMELVDAFNSRGSCESSRRSSDSDSAAGYKTEDELDSKARARNLLPPQAVVGLADESDA